MAPGQSPPRRMSGCLIALIVVLGLIVIGGLAVGIVGGLLSGSRGGERSLGSGLGGGDCVALITISGVIGSGDEAPSLFSSSGAGEMELTKQLREAAKDDSVKAVLLRINSPGGSAAASWSIYKEVLRLRGKKPVVVSMGDVAASGGYYIASAAEWIVAGPATETGSIGVITEVLNYSELAAKFGVKGEIFTSGPYKDSMNPLRAMRPDERDMIKAMIMDVYGQFVADVAVGRKLKPEQVRHLADGRVYTGSQAKKVGLVDELGNFRDALDIAAKRGGIKGEPRVRQMGHTSGLYSLLNGSSDTKSMAELARLATQQTPVGPGLWMLMQVDRAVMAK
jgi:protease-4